MKQVLIKNSDNYFVREDGKVIGKTGIVLKENIVHGYAYVSVKTDGKFRPRRVHRLVAEAFIPNPDKLPEVNHIDGVKTNNRVSNLEWVTSQQNSKHATNVLGKGVGENHGCATLSNEIVHEICRMMVSGYQNSYITEKLGVTKDIVGKIRRRASWTTVSSQYNFPPKSRALSEDTVRWVCVQLELGKTPVEIRDMSKNPKLTLQVIKGIKGRYNYRHISSNYDF